MTEKKEVEYIKMFTVMTDETLAEVIDAYSETEAKYLLKAIIKAIRSTPIKG